MKDSIKLGFLVGQHRVLAKAADADHATIDSASCRKCRLIRSAVSALNRSVSYFKVPRNESLRVEHFQCQVELAFLLGKIIGIDVHATPVGLPWLFVKQPSRFIELLRLLQSEHDGADGQSTRVATRVQPIDQQREGIILVFDGLQRAAVSHVPDTRQRSRS